MKPQKKLFFHIGWAKCGTSTLQHFLFANRELLLEQGIYYPKIKSFYNHICISAENITPEDRESYYRILLKKLEESQANTLIISAEGTQFTQPEIFEELFQRYDTYIICYMRSCIGYVNSTFCQRIRRGYDMSYLFDITVEQNKILWIFKDKIEDWIKRLGLNKFIFKSYHEAAAKGLIEDLCETLNINKDPRFIYPGDKNISPSKAYQAFMLPLNFTPIKGREYRLISSQIIKIDQKINANFNCNFIPSRFFKNPSAELIQTIERQGELLNNPHWLERFYNEAGHLSDNGWHDLPTHLQHAFYNNMSQTSKRILRKYLTVDINDIEKPFLPSIEELSPEDFKSQVELRRNFITKRIEDEQSLKIRRPILFRIFWLKKKTIGFFIVTMENFYLFASKTILYKAYTTLHQLFIK